MGLVSERTFRKEGSPLNLLGAEPMKLGLEELGAGAGAEAGGLGGMAEGQLPVEGTNEIHSLLLLVDARSGDAPSR